MVGVRKKDNSPPAFPGEARVAGGAVLPEERPRMTPPLLQCDPCVCVRKKSSMLRVVAARVVAVARDEGGEGDREDVTACATSGAPAPRARPPPPVRRSRRFVRSVGGARRGRVRWAGDAPCVDLDHLDVEDRGERGAVRPRSSGRTAEAERPAAGATGSHPGLRTARRG